MAQVSIDRPRPIQLSSLSLSTVNDALARIQGRMDQSDRRLGSTLLSVQVEEVPTLGTTEENLLIYNMPGLTLSRDLQQVLVLSAWGTVAANGNDKSMGMYAGANLIAYNTITTAPNGVNWTIEVMLVRVNKNLLSGWLWMLVGDVPQLAATGRIPVNLEETAQIRVSAITPGAAGDVTAQGLVVERRGLIG